MKRAYSKAGLSSVHTEMLEAAKSYDAWQRGAHSFYSGAYNTTQSKYITAGHEGNSIWPDAVGQTRLETLVGKLHAGSAALGSSQQSGLLAGIGCNGYHDMVSALDMIRGMLQDFCIDLTGSQRPSSDDVMTKLEAARAFFTSGLYASSVEAQEDTEALQAATTSDLAALGVGVAHAAESGEGTATYVTSNMGMEGIELFDDGSYMIAVRDMDSLATSVMTVPAGTPGADNLQLGLANLTITYTLSTEFENDLAYRYVVTNIAVSDAEHTYTPEGTYGSYAVMGSVTSVAADKKSLVLDLHGVDELNLKVGDEVADVPQAGMYICARYVATMTDLVLSSYEEVDKPGERVKVTYPVEAVSGSSLLLLTNADASGDGSGQRSYLRVYYGTADMYVVPQEGKP